MIKKEKPPPFLKVLKNITKRIRNFTEALQTSNKNN